MKHRNLVLILLILLLLPACQSNPAKSPEEAPRFELATPGSLNSAINAIQSVDIIHEGSKYQFQAVVAVTSDRIQLVALNPLGQRLASLDYSGGELQVDRSSQLPQEFPLRYMLESMQMIFWPASALDEQQTDSNWGVSSSNGKRHIRYRGRPVVVIDYSSEDPWQSVSTLQHQLFDFKLTITSKRLPAATP